MRKSEDVEEGVGGEAKRPELPVKAWLKVIHYLSVTLSKKAAYFQGLWL